MKREEGERRERKKAIRREKETEREKAKGTNYHLARRP